jgi:protein ImuB
VGTSNKPPARPREAAPTPSLKNGQSRQKHRHKAHPQLSLAEFSDPVPLSCQPGLCRQLWLGVYLPVLPLEAVVNTNDAAAVFEEQQGIRKILLANTKASAAGVKPGLAINAALALLPTLQLEERNPAREAQVLKDLAAWSEKFTAFTVIDVPSLLLLEIAGSLKLFGGIKPLREHIIKGLVRQGFQIEVAIAPTPLAATWFARAGRKVCIRDARNLVGKLAPLPIHCLDWPDAVTKSLRGMGVTTIGEALRLPRQGFAKRFTAIRLLELDRALGSMPDPRVSYRAPERFVADYDLNEEESDSTLLLNICQELLMRLERFLLSRQMAVQHIEFIFFHLQAPATHLVLGCVQADRAVKHWFDLLAIKFDRLILPAPVIVIQLRGGQGQAFTAETGILPFSKQERQQRGTSMTHLAERLSARMGEQAVHGVMTVAEHRPQYAWRRCNAFDEVSQCAYVPPALLADIRRANSLVLQRPLWMLQVPELLLVEQGVPCYQGALRLLDGPERIETGWWDEDGIARDYFVACNPGGVHLWVYQDRGSDRCSRHWYLHGMFG